MLEKCQKLYTILARTAEEIEQYYTVKQVKPYAVYISDKNTGKNIFDIHAKKIILHDIEHTIIKESKSIIIKIQAKLNEIGIEELK